MVLKKSYSRYFIILQEDEKGYSLASDKIASGYAKLEVKNDKCKISYYVQNLKREMAPYYMMLICNKKDIKKVINIGEMNIDDYGRADICYEYPVENVAGSRVSVDKVSGAAIVKLLDNNIVSIMSGFASTDIPNWKSFALIEDATREVKEPENKEEPRSIFDKYEESIEVVKLDEPKEEVIKEEEIVEDIELVRQDVEVEEPQNEILEEEKLQPEADKVSRDEELVREDEQVDREENENVDLEHRDVKEKGSEDLNNEFFRDQQIEEDKKNDSSCSRASAEDFFRNLVEGFEEIKYIKTDIKRVEWYRIPVRQIEDMYDASNYNKYAIIYYPMVSYHPYFEKHGHYLIGYKYDKKENVKYLVYGIPGYKNKEYQPYGGKTGFVTWVPADHRDDKEFGYWLMFYDFKTSTIVVPVKK